MNRSKIFLLPETSCSAEHFVRFIRRERFQRVHNSRKRLSNARRAEHVNMIWHDDPSGQTVLLLIVKQQRILHHPGHIRVFQITTAMALIEVGFYSTAHDCLGLSGGYEF